MIPALMSRNHSFSIESWMSGETVHTVTVRILSLYRFIRAGIMKLRTRRKKRNPGYLLLAMGVLIIFTSSLLNALYSSQFGSGSQVSRGVYIFDLISTLGVIFIPLGLRGIMKKEETCRGTGLSSYERSEGACGLPLGIDRLERRRTHA
jgi:hypothetical protein